MAGGRRLRTLSYRYDLAGKLTSAFDDPNSAGCSFLPDELNRLEIAMIGLPGFAQVQLIGEYDKNNNRTQLAAFVGATMDFVNG